MRKVLLTALLFLVSLYLSLAAGINRGDEAWFLQVMRRVHQGDVLYRDVFYGAGPLAVFLTMPLIYLIGVEILAVKIVVAASYTVSLLLGMHILERIGADPKSRLIFLGVNLLFAPPAPHAPYQSLANTFLMAASDSTMAALNTVDPRARLLFLAGAGSAAGLSFAAKQNIGVYVLLAILGALLIKRPGAHRDLCRWAIEIRTAILAFSLAVALTFLPIWLGGGGSKFLDYGLINKQAYLRLAGIPYTDGLQGALRSLQALSPRATIEQGLWTLRFMAFLLPFIAGVFWIAGLSRIPATKRPHWAAIGLFAGAAFLGVFPRADYAHLIYAIPTLWIVILGAWSAIKIRSWKITIERGAGAFIALALLLALSAPSIRVLQGRLTISTLPHFYGPLIDPALQTRIQEEAEQLQARAPDNSLFLLFPTAGFYYLVAGLHNPTPFDFPTATSFGRNGQKEVIQAIREGRIHRICYWRWDWNLRPVEIETFVEQEMEYVEDLGICKLYRAGP